MSKLVLQMQMTVDGFVGGPKGEIDWVFKTLDDAVTTWIVERLWQASVHIMGSRTFNDMAAHWPSSTEPYAAPMNQIPKVVFSRKGAPSIAEGWARSRVASGALADEITRLKRESGKEILAHGGAQFARSLAQSGLVDEYRLLVHPVALGSGLALFSGLAKPLDLNLVSTTPFGAGTVAQVYRPARAASGSR
jgi:dihydrofolate reductase